MYIYGHKTVSYTHLDVYKRQDKGLEFNLSDADMQEIDGAFASAYVKAHK